MIARAFNIGPKRESAVVFNDNVSVEFNVALSQKHSKTVSNPTKL